MWLPSKSMDKPVRCLIILWKSMENTYSSSREVLVFKKKSVSQMGPITWKKKKMVKRVAFI